MDRKIAEQIVALVNGTIDQLIATLGPGRRGGITRGVRGL